MFDAYCAYHFGYTPEQIDDADYDRLIGMMQAVPTLLGQGDSDAQRRDAADRAYSARADARMTGRGW